MNSRSVFYKHCMFAAGCSSLGLKRPGMASRWLFCNIIVMSTYDLLAVFIAAGLNIMSYINITQDHINNY